MDQIEQLGAMAQQLGCPYSFHEPMSRHTTFRIGGSVCFCRQPRVSQSDGAARQ